MTDTEPGAGVTRMRDSEAQISIQSVEAQTGKWCERESERRPESS